MKKFIFQIITIAFVFCLIGFAQASLIGDWVLVEPQFPMFTPPVDRSDDVNVLVAAGTTDVIRIEGTYDVNMEESSVDVDFLTMNTYETRSFNGLVLGDLDFETEYILLGVEVTTNLAGWNDSRLELGVDYVGFNWQDLTVFSDTDFTAIFEFGPNPIPIPSTLLLFVTGLTGFFLIKRKITS